MKVNQNPQISKANETQSHHTQRSQGIRKFNEASKTSDVRANEADVKSDISLKAKEFATAKAVADSAPDVREAKIAELRERIRNKEYNVKPEDIAERMVRDHMDTLGVR
ncbi:MAG: flagellar biosynthesis anti-sigma factor FlgM [Bdellovibrionaceae bacterium]|nr:flagellar biosynthesis anti-sigma factor FlgM [Pseudobdellovibrionaceae bacterium]|tara:strand:- start:1303 stop:1629 length:327 start_codon:yes stop_codon:yes gene_type:complete